MKTKNTINIKDMKILHNTNPAQILFETKEEVYKELKDINGAIERLQLYQKSLLNILEIQ